MNKTKKIISLLLSLILTLSVFNIVPFTAGAAEKEAAETGAISGTTGECTWTLDDNGVLTISGNGKMGNYNYWDYSSAPWENGSFTEAVIEKGVTTIGNEAFFYNRELTKVTIPDTVTDIGIEAFSGCRNLTSVNIPDSVTSISQSAFYCCTGIKTVTLNQTGVDSFQSAFENCDSIETVILKDSVTSVDKSAFYGCEKLKSVTIPASVTSIGSKAFGYYKDVDFDTDLKVSGFTIYGYSDSQAERYANDNAFIFVALDVQPTEPAPTEPAPTEPAPTEPAPIVPENSALVTVKGMNGQSETAVYKVGESFTVYTTLDTSEVEGGRIASLAGTQTYTDSVLILNAEVDKDGLALDEDTMFPITGYKSMANCGKTGVIYFIASEPSMQRSFLFDSDTSELIVTTYTVTAPGSAVIETKLSSLSLPDYKFTRIISDGQLTDSSYKVSMVSSFNEKAPVEEYVFGDVNGDGEADTLDATLIQRYATFVKVPYSDEMMMRGDTDGDGELTVLDATYIQRFATRVPVPYPVGQAL